MEALFYVGEVGLLYTGLYLIYFLMFRNNTHFYLNRLYLLLIVPVSFLLPTVNLQTALVNTYQIILPAIEIDDISINKEASYEWWDITFYAYCLFSALMAGLFIYRLSVVFLTIYLIKSGKQNSKTLPFSFFRWIYLPESIEEEDKKAIYIHEKVHAHELHSLDIMLYELSKILLWWNPFLWMGLNSVKINHEYIADKLASEKSNKYSSVLVAQMLGVNCSVLANNFKSQLLIKKRIMMMKTKRSNRLSVLKYALAIPVVAVAMVTTTDPVIARSTESVYQKGVDDVYDTVDVMPEFKGGMEALVNYLIENINYPEAAKKEHIKGKVLVSFIVNNRGQVKEVKVKQSVNELLDKEAVRVVSNMPNWKPGKKDGKKVNVKYVLPIDFRL